MSKPYLIRNTIVFPQIGLTFRKLCFAISSRNYEMRSREHGVWVYNKDFVFSNDSNDADSDWFEKSPFLH